MAQRAAGRKRPVKKRKAQPQSPGEPRFPRDAARAWNYSIDLAWGYPEEDRRSIANFLNYRGGLTNDQIEWALNEITAAARHYQGEVIPRPKTTVIRKQIGNLAGSLEQLHSCIAALSPEARATLDSLGLALDGQPVMPALIDTRRSLGRAYCISDVAANATEKTGRPRMEARWIFIKRLAAIWAAVHGEWPNRTGWDEEREEFPFNLFAWECVEPLAGKKGLDHAIREVCDMDPAATEAIVRTYVPSKAPRKK